MTEILFTGQSNSQLKCTHSHAQPPTQALTITKTRLYNFDPIKLHFYIIKLGFKGVYIIFLISTQKHRLWVLVRTAFGRRF